MKKGSKTKLDLIDSLTDEDIDTSDIAPLGKFFFTDAQLRLAKTMSIDITSNAECSDNEEVNPKFNLAEMVKRMPYDYHAQEESFGKPVGLEEW